MAPVSAVALLLLVCAAANPALSAPAEEDLDEVQVVPGSDVIVEDKPVIVYQDVLVHGHGHGHGYRHGYRYGYRHGAPLRFTSCSQISTSYSGNCERAIDGNTNQQYTANSCSHTVNGGWWTARLEGPARIGEVRIYNRQDCCSDRLTNFVILVDGHECASYNSPTAFSVQSFSCNRVGSSLTIRSNLATPLTLCEVQAFGEPAAASGAEQLRLSGCSQSSISYAGNCERAIDGNPNQQYHAGSCSHTASGGWWSARTDGPARIAEVKIYNRQDCCSERLNNFVILVDGHECASYNSPTAFSVQTFSCDRVGSTLTIKTHQNTPLTLCEVQVFGQLQ